jgi:hypothetical protein
MGGVRTVFGGILCIIAGLIAFVLGLSTLAMLSLPADNWLCGFFIHRWNEAIGMTTTNPTFGYVWLFGLFMWSLCTLLLIIGGAVGFRRGGVTGLVGAILFFLFDLIVNLTATNTGLGNDGLAGLFDFIAIVIFLIGLFGGILQASAQRKR